MPTTAKLFFGATQLGGAFPAAAVTGGTVIDYTEGGVTWRQHELRSTGSLTITDAGYVDTLLLIAGGGNAGSNAGQYAGGGGGGGGFFLLRWSYLDAQTISATIGGARGNSSAVIQGYGTIPGNTITCGAGANGGGGGSGGGGGTGFGGNAGSNGGGPGGSGGGGAAPGWSATGGAPTISQTLGYGYSLRGVSFGNGGGSGANTGNGASAGSNGSGGSGVLIIRYPLITS